MPIIGSLNAYKVIILDESFRINGCVSIIAAHKFYYRHF